MTNKYYFGSIKGKACQDDQNKCLLNCQVEGDALKLRDQMTIHKAAINSNLVLK